MPTLAADWTDPASTAAVIALATAAGAGLMKFLDWAVNKRSALREAEAARVGRRRTDALAPYAKQIEDLRKDLDAADVEINKLRQENIACEKKSARLEAEVEYLKASAASVRADIADLKATLSRAGLRENSGFHAIPPAGG